MANFSASITVRDGDGQDSVVTLYGVFADSATALTALQAAAETMDDLILGKVVSATLSQDVAIGGWSLKASPAAGADVEIKGRFIFQTANPKVKPRLSIPTFDKDTYTAVGGDIPYNLSGSAPVDVFLVAMVDQNWTDYRYEDFTDVLKAYEEFE